MSNILDISVLENHKYDEITINIVGNVDSGKSSLCGILSHNNLLNEQDHINSKNSELNDILDDGNGKSRQRVLSLKHEKISGRTSSISYNYLLLRNTLPRPKIISLIDLAGHSSYLKTTITGVVSTYPECGFVLIAKNITQMTREHYAILSTMNIPILFIFTKIDFIPEKIINSNINSAGIMSKKYKKELIQYIPCIENDDILHNDNDNFDQGKPNSKIDHYIKLSNKTGEGFNSLLHYISNIKKKKKNLLRAFSIDSVYHNITGFGTVVAGLNGIPICKGDNLYMGPFDGKKFIPVKIRSIHNDYRQFIDTLNTNVRGCLCIKYDTTYRKQIKSGIIITQTEIINISKNPGLCAKNRIDSITPVNKFEAYIAIFRGSGSNIKLGYCSYINIGLTRGHIKITKIKNKDTNELIDVMDSKYAIVEIEFTRRYVCINKNDRFLFRSDRVNGIGKVINIINDN